MKRVALLLALIIAAAGSAEEKKVNPRAFRMPSKKVEPAEKKTEPEKKALPAQPVVAKSPDAAAAPAAVGQQPPGEPPSPLAPAAVAAPPGEPVTNKPATSPTAFRMPNASVPGSPAVASEEPVKPAAKDVAKKEPKTVAPAFRLPGAKPAPAKKKNPVTFRMPEKKSE